MSTRVACAGLVGPTNVHAALTADAEELINGYAEPIAPGTGKVPAYLRRVPGLHPWLTLPTSPVRALFQQDQRAFAIAGDTFYEIFATPSYTAYTGTPLSLTGGYLPSIVSNGSAGNQLGMTSGDLGYVFNLTLNTLTQITDPGFPTRVRMMEFMDGYAIVLCTESRAFQISALEDFTAWDPLDVAERSMASDQIASLIRLGRTILLLGVKTSEPWYDSGDPLFPFAPTQESLMEHGSAASFTARRLNDTVYWLGQDEDGQGLVWRLNGMRPEAISPPAINAIIQAAGAGADNDLRSSTAWTYQQDGHSFYCLQLPNTIWTLVYDTFMDRWHKRAVWDAENYTWLRDRPQCHMQFAGKHLVGDRLTGTIYEQSLSFYDAQLTTV